MRTKTTEMASNEVKEFEDISYDYFEDHKLLFVFSGWSKTYDEKKGKRNTWVIIYNIIMVAVQLFVQVMGIYAAYLLTSQKSLFFDSIHVITASVFAVWGLGMRILAERSIYKTMDSLRLGIYIYKDEELDKKQIEMKEAIPGEIKLKTKVLTILYVIAFLSNMVYFPISQYFIVDEETAQKYPTFLNPYLPHIFYIPFNTNSALGYTIIYIMDFCFMLFIYTTAVSLNSIYITCTVVIKGQFRLLNHSIKTIQTRAYLMYKKNNNFEPSKISGREFMSTITFKNCLYTCLKENIMHHQALIRFKDECSVFIGSILLSVFVLAAIIYASVVYQIYQTIPLNILVNYVCISMAEQTYTFYICFFGEDLIQESSNVFLNLYEINWSHYDGKFNRALRIMMINTKKIMSFKSYLLNFSASVETYGEILSAVYKIMNLARQSDVLN